MLNKRKEKEKNIEIELDKADKEAKENTKRLTHEEVFKDLIR